MQEVQAHRGASAYAPENTLPAYQKAVEIGADAIEIDVRLTADKKIVISHDGCLERCAGQPGVIGNHTFAELRAMDFSNGWDNFSNVLIPTLEECYELIKPTSLYVNCEIKDSLGEIEPMLAKVAYDMGMQNRVLYSSFYPEALVAVKKFHPECKCGYLFGDDIDFGEEGIANYHKRMGFEAVHGCHIVLPDEVIAECNASGLEVNPWTIDAETDMHRLFKAGVHSIITNVPDRGMKIRDMYR